MRQRCADHAVVLGASMAGLLAARVLSESYRLVTIVDRDEMPAVGVHRRGVPQGRHLHGLHPRDREVLDELFEGFTDGLVADGAVIGDVLGDCRWQLSGHQYCKVQASLPGLLCSRPFLEGHVRAGVTALPSVRLVERCDVMGLTSTADRGRVTGVRVHHDDSAGEEMLSADLVVDATGRGSRLPLWLEQLGYDRPEQDRVEIGLGYATRILRLRPGALDDMLVLTAGTPTNPRSGFLAGIEGGRHILTLTGILGDHPPTDPAGFEAFAASLPSPDIAEAIVGAEPLGEPVAFRFPVSARHRYERLDRFPAGLLAIGDAVCSFNPVYGQGMTVAASEAMTLRRLLAAGSPPAPRRYFRAIAKVVDVPWDIAVGADLAFPGVAGRRTAKTREDTDGQRLLAPAARCGELRRLAGAGVPSGARSVESPGGPAAARPRAARAEASRPAAERRAVRYRRLDTDGVAKVVDHWRPPCASRSTARHRVVAVRARRGCQPLDPIRCLRPGERAARRVPAG